MHPLMETYLQYLINHGRKRGTLKSYRAGLERACEILEPMGLTTDPRRMTAEEAFIIKDALGCKEASARLYIKVVKLCCDHYHNPRFGEADILWNRPTRSVHWIDEDQYRELLDGAPPPVRIFLVLGGLMGLRCLEIVQLTVDDIHADTLRVIGKGHGAGLIMEQPMPPAVKAELVRYLRWRADQPAGSRRLLWWGTERATDPEHLENVAYMHIVKYAREKGIAMSPHALRRFYATTLYRKGADLVTISKLMRHASVETTQRYIRDDPEAIRDAAALMASFLE